MKKQKKEKKNIRQMIGYSFVVFCMVMVGFFNVLTFHATGVMDANEFANFYEDSMEMQDNFCDLADGMLEALDDEEEKRLMQAAAKKETKIR